MKIDLELKRTYEIEEGKLLDYFDSEVVANDELLTKYLAKNKEAVLKRNRGYYPEGKRTKLSVSRRITTLSYRAWRVQEKLTVAMHKGISVYSVQLHRKVPAEDFLYRREQTGFCWIILRGCCRI